MPEQQQDILVTIIIATVFFLLLGFFLLVLLFLFLRKQRKNQQEKEEMKNRFEKTILNTQLEIQDQTLSYIASEIHDNIGQILYLSRLDILNLHPETVSKRKFDIEQLLEKAFNDLRAISHGLKNNHFHQIGLYESIHQLLLNIEKNGKFTTVFDCPDQSVDYDEELKSKSIILYRMVQEIINNILKHAAANQIYVSIQKLEKDIFVQVKDNGKGFDTRIIQDNQQGIGLQNIFDRAKLIGAKVDIQSNFGTGTAISINIPTKSLYDESSLGR
ncbi:MAG: hypothetical protein EAZ62_05710 [Sphingobacteriia bacterium]|nr:MAG: hypothetical protein EAZ62_05710 [Sphingobacteriia bacterium]